jgi:hypothetical protein
MGSDVARSSRIASDDECSLNFCYGLHNGLTRTLPDHNAAVTQEIETAEANRDQRLA